MSKDEILKKNYWSYCKGRVSKSTIENESPLIYNAMQEYADQEASDYQNRIKELESENEKQKDLLNHLESIINHLKK